MEKKLRKLLIGFFIIMLLLTITSRAADSVMVAKVTIDRVKKGSLTFELSGAGTVKDNANKYLALKGGYKIGKVQAEEGEEVKKGDLLFAYDTSYLQELVTKKEKEWKKLKLQYEKFTLETENGSKEPEEEKARKDILNAKEDVQTAKEALYAKKQSVREKKEEEYTALIAEEEEQKIAQSEALKTAGRTVADAETERNKLNEPKIFLEEYLAEYKAAVIKKEEEAEKKYIEKLLNLYYKDKYEEHRNKVLETEKKLKRAREDLKDIEKKWEEKLDYWDQFSREEELVKAYKEQALLREAEIKTANREISDLEESLIFIKDEDEVLDKAFADYRLDVITYSQNVKLSYEVLYKLLYEKMEYDEAKLNTANVKLARAREDEANIQEEWNGKRNKLGKKKSRIEADLQAIKEGKYDYEEDIKEEKRALETAVRTLEAVQLQLKQLEVSIKTGKENEQMEEKVKGLEKSSLMLDITEKCEEIDELNSLIKKKGRVTSPVDGTVAKLDITTGLTLSGGEKIVVATGEYELLMKADKEEIKYFQIGDEVIIKTGEGNDNLTGHIETIGLPDADGKINFSCLLPKGEFRTGMSLSYELKRTSEDYRYCIPLEAVRQDNSGYYILLVKEKDSVLGKEQTTFRMGITVIQKDFKMAAINATLSEQDVIIVGSSKYISEGDRVRVYEME